MFIREKGHTFTAIGFGTEVFGAGRGEGLYAEQPGRAGTISGLWFGPRVTVEITPDSMDLKQQAVWIGMKRRAARKQAA